VVLGKWSANLKLPITSGWPVRALPLDQTGSKLDPTS
jgi:hypothetical protein